MKQSFRSFTFVSDDSSSSSSLGEGEEEDDESSSSSSSAEEEEVQGVDFEDPEYIVKSILKGIVSTPGASKRPRLSPAATTPSPIPTPTPTPTPTETEHQRLLRMRAERFKPAPPPPHRLYANSFLFPSLTRECVIELKQAMGDMPAAKANGFLPKKWALAALKLTKPVELTNDALEHVKTPVLSLQSLHSRLAALFTEHFIQFQVSPASPSLLLFPVPLQLDDHLYHWMVLRHSFASHARVPVPNNTLGCTVYSFGPTLEEREQDEHAYDVRWLGATKLDKYEYLCQVLGDSSSSKLDGAVRNKANAVLFEDGMEELSATELLRIRRDVLRRRNNALDRSRLVQRAQACAEAELPELFRQEHCTALFGAEVLKSASASWAELDLAKFKPEDWVHGHDRFVAEDGAFAKKVSAFLFKNNVKFKACAEHRAFEINSPLTLEDRTLAWVLPVNSMLLDQPLEQAVRELTARLGAGCVMFAFGFSAAMLPEADGTDSAMLPVDWRQLAVE